MQTKSLIDIPQASENLTKNQIPAILTTTFHRTMTCVDTARFTYGNLSLPWTLNLMLASRYHKSHVKTLISRKKYIRDLRSIVSVLLATTQYVAETLQRGKMYTNNLVFQYHLNRVFQMIEVLELKSPEESDLFHL